jgi:hypothetical protein
MPFQFGAQCEVVWDERRDMYVPHLTGCEQGYKMNNTPATGNWEDEICYIGIRRRPPLNSNGRDVAVSLQ